MIFALLILLDHFVLPSLPSVILSLLLIHPSPKFLLLYIQLTSTIADTSHLQPTYFLSSPSNNLYIHIINYIIPLLSEPMYNAFSFLLHNYHTIPHLSLTVFSHSPHTHLLPLYSIPPFYSYTYLHIPILYQS